MFCLKMKTETGSFIQAIINNTLLQYSPKYTAARWAVDSHTLAAMLCVMCKKESECLAITINF